MEEELERLVGIARELARLRDELQEAFRAFLEEVWCPLTEDLCGKLSPGERTVEVVFTHEGETYKFAVRMGSDTLEMYRKGRFDWWDHAYPYPHFLPVIVEKLPEALERKADELRGRCEDARRALEMIAKVMRSEEVRSEVAVERLKDL